MGFPGFQPDRHISAFNLFQDGPHQLHELRELRGCKSVTDLLDHHNINHGSLAELLWTVEDGQVHFTS